jgi:CDP-glucose 4,6-dehydratase
VFKNVFYQKKVLITGNTGFKGSWLSTWLLSLNAEVYGYSDKIPTKPSLYEACELDKKITQKYADIRDYREVKNTIENIQPDYIFHLAAQPLVYTSYLDPLETISTNVLGTSNVLEALREVNPDCIAIIITSDKCYDNVEWVWGYKETDALGGKDVYSGSKGAAEMITKSYFHSFFKDMSQNRVRVASVRAGNVIGGGDWADFRIIPDCIRAWINGNSVEIRSPKATRPWQHVLEPLSGYLSLAVQLGDNVELNGETFNFGPDAEYSTTVETLLNDMSKYWKLKQSPSFVSKKESKFHEASLLKLNCDKALFYLNWLPTLDYEHLIKYTATWYYNYYYAESDMFDQTLEQIREYETIATGKGIKWTK